MNDYELRQDILDLLQKHGLVWEKSSVRSLRRGLATREDRIEIRIVAKEAA